MLKTAEKIATFLAEHHLLSLATSVNNQPQSASLFYAYDADQQLFIVASDKKTQHIQNVMHNPYVSGTVALETDEIGKIRGLQFKAKMEAIDDVAGQLYYQHFAYARVMKPQLWSIVIDEMKFTDNRLGFGKKLQWKREF